MSRCNVCHHDGLYFVEHADPDGYVVLACNCPRGGMWETPQQLKAFCARLDPPPIWYGRLEEFFTEAELKALKTVEREHQVQDGKERVAYGERQASDAVDPPVRHTEARPTRA